MNVIDFSEYIKGALDCEAGATPTSDREKYLLGFGDMYQAIEAGLDISVSFSSREAEPTKTMQFQQLKFDFY